MVERNKIIARLADNDYRHGLVEAEIANGIAFQLKAMLRDRGWTQQILAERAGTAQPLISKYLSGYENYNLQTLKRLASGLDVGLIVSFAPFSEIVNRITRRTYASVAIPSYPVDPGLAGEGLSLREFTLVTSTPVTVHESDARSKVVSLTEYRKDRHVRIASISKATVTLPRSPFIHAS